MTSIRSEASKCGTRAGLFRILAWFDPGFDLRLTTFLMEDWKCLKRGSVTVVPCGLSEQGQIGVMFPIGGNILDDTRRDS